VAERAEEVEEAKVQNKNALALIFTLGQFLVKLWHTSNRDTSGTADFLILFHLFPFFLC